MSDGPPRVDIVIPVLDEEASLVGNVERVLAHLDAELADGYRCRVVIGDNGSTDATPALAEELERRYPERVRLVRVPERGVGLALKTAWSRSDADLVGYMDLDLATDLRHLRPALDAIARDGHDLVYGTRLHPEARVIGRSLKRAVVSRVFNRLLRGYLGVSISDGMCGFKFLRRALVDELLAGGARSDGWFFCTEILVVAEWRGKRLAELPVSWTDDPGSKVKIGKLSREYLAAMRVLKRERSAIRDGR